MKIFLHIGQSKTGTSAIQAYLTLNRRKLAEQKILYPATVSGGVEIDMGNHNSVADSLCGVMKFPYVTADEFFSHTFAESTRIRASQIILSAEHFFGGEPRIWNVSDHDEFYGAYRRKVEILARYLAGHQTHVLVYLRPQANWFASAVSQTVRIQGLLSERQIYQDDRQFFEMAKPVLRYKTLLEIWQDALRPGSFDVVPYHETVLRGGSIIPDFLTRAHLQQMHLPYANTDLRVNESLTQEFIEVKKRFNRIPHSKSEERVAIRCLERLSRERGGNTVYQPCPNVLGDLINFVGPENAALQKRYGIAADVLNEAVAQSSRPLSAKDVEDAWEIFERKFRSARVRLMIVDDLARQKLREHAPILHGLMHRFKMVRRRRRRLRSSVTRQGPKAAD